MLFRPIHELAGLNYPQKPEKRTTYSDSPQPAPKSIKWASVNGYQSSHGEGEESSDEYDLSSAPDSEQEWRQNNHSDAPARVSAPPTTLDKNLDPHTAQSTPLQTRAQATVDMPSQQPIVPSMPLIIQEAPQANGQAQGDFDVVAAQSKGKAIAPRQPQLSSTPMSMYDDGQLPPPEHRPMQRNKRSREPEGINQDSRSSSTLIKRRKQQSEPTETTMALGGINGGYPTSFNPSVAMPIAPPPALPPPSRVPLDSEVEQVCMQVRDLYRTTRAAFDEERGVTKAIYAASLERANAREHEAKLRCDDLSLRYAEQVKENNISAQVELNSMKSKFHTERAEKDQLRVEIEQYRERLAAAEAALEQERNAKLPESLGDPATQMPTASDTATIEALQQQLRLAKENAEHADAANDLLDEEFRNKFQEIKRQHDEVTATINDLDSKDLEALTHKVTKKFVTAVKEADNQLSDTINKVGDSLNKPKHLIFASAGQSVNPTANGTASKEQIDSSISR